MILIVPCVLFRPLRSPCAHCTPNAYARHLRIRHLSFPAISFAGVGNNCANGELKISVHVFKEEDFVEDAPTPPATVTQAPSTADSGNDAAVPAVAVAWSTGIGEGGRMETITQDDFVRATIESHCTLHCQAQ